MMITGSLLSTTGTEQFPLTHTASITSLGSPSLGNVDDVNDIEAIEIQRIPQLGRSKSYEKQLEVESINKFYDNTATDVHIRFLNQASEWVLNEKGVLAMFNDFKRS